MREQIEMTPPLLDYIRKVSLRDDTILHDLRASNAALPERIMQILPEEAQLLALLVRLTQARRVLEIGTFTGYSTLCMARALPPGGRITTCDVSKEWTDVAQRFWRRAEVEDRIDLRVGDARELVGQLEPDSFDFAFIDAFKADYPQYLEAALTVVRSGGLIVLDNTLWSGQVIDPACTDADTLGIRTVNEALLADERVDLAMLPMADGVTLALKR